MKLSDADFLKELKSELGPDMAKTREAERIATAKKLATDRVAALADFDREFAKLEKIEEEKLAAFHQLSEKLERARQEAYAAYVARTTLQSEIERRVGAINSKIAAHRNPLAGELFLRLGQIAEEALRIGVVRQELDKSLPITAPTFRRRKDIEIRTNRAARRARQYFPVRIVNALQEVILAGHDSDAALLAVFDAGVAALPGDNVLRLEDDIPSQYSPHFEKAVSEFAKAVDIALEGALKEALSHE